MTGVFGATLFSLKRLTFNLKHMYRQCPEKAQPGRVLWNSPLKVVHQLG